MDVLYRKIRERCQKRIDNGEEYTIEMWFEEANSFQREIVEEGLQQTAHEISKMIVQQTFICKT